MVPGKGYLNRLNCVTVLLATMLAVGLWVMPSFAAETVCDSCIPCHGPLEDVHGDFNHNAEPGSGSVAIFADRTHDDAAWAYGQPGPHFDITVNCGTCHNSDLPAVHGGDCATCHPTPYDTLGTWGKSCQQGGCHASIHQEVVPSHDPWETAWNDSGNNCQYCHNPSTWAVTENECVKCHGIGATALPITEAKDVITRGAVRAEYIGPAMIDFTITAGGIVGNNPGENGKVGVGRTFYKLNNGSVTAAGKYALVSDDNPGLQELEFWSKAQNGKEESSHKVITFNIVEDTDPPVTTSDARANYTNGGRITLTATDNSTLGAKKTYYRLTLAGQSPGAAVAGTVINLPSSQGTFNYTLEYWSVDWSGNEETHHTTSFTVTNGTGTIRLVWWDADVNPNHGPTYGDSIEWQIRLYNSNGYIYKSGSSVYGDGWNGVNNISVQLRSTPYFVKVDWSWQDEEEIGTETATVYVTSPGQLVKVNY